MTIMPKLTWILASTVACCAMAMMFGFLSGQIGSSDDATANLEVRVDENVRPAAAEIDLVATPLKGKKPSRVQQAVYQTSVIPNRHDGVIRDAKVQLCQGCDCGSGQCATCSNAVVGLYPTAVAQAPAAHANYVETSAPGFMQTGYGQPTHEMLPSKALCAVDKDSGRKGREPRWAHAKSLEWEQYAYGEYVGPFRAPHVPDYRIRIGDRLEFVYLLTRQRSNEPYRLYVGDTIQVTSTTDSTLNQPRVQILADGTVSLPLIGNIRVAGKTINNLQRELNDRYTEYLKTPEIVVQVVEGDTPLRDLRDAVDARAGQGGQSRFAVVSPDGTVQLPLVGSVPAIGLTLEEIGREINARYRLYLGGVVVTPILSERAQRFIYVVGEVERSGRFELTGPTSAMQAIALAQGFRAGGNMRQVIVFRRDANWQLIATKLDLNGALNGRRPYPSDEIWLRDSDIVLVPKKPIQRLSEVVNQYLTNTIYGIFPQQGIQFNFDNFQSL